MLNAAAWSYFSPIWWLICREVETYQSFGGEELVCLLHGILAIMHGSQISFTPSAECFACAAAFAYRFAFKILLNPYLPQEMSAESNPVFDTQ